MGIILKKIFLCVLILLVFILAAPAILITGIYFFTKVLVKYFILTPWKISNEWANHFADLVDSGAERLDKEVDKTFDAKKREG